MATKNIVNIQNNKLDFYVNGTNKFNVTLRDTPILEVSESGHIKAVQSEADFNSPKAASTYDFLGYISNINNHSIGNLSDVSVSGAAPNQILRFTGSVWENVSPTSIFANELTISDGTSTNKISLDTGTLKILGTTNEIETSIGATAGEIQIGLPDNVVISNNLTVTGNLIVNGGQTIINTEVKLIEDSIIELNYTPDSHHNLDYDIGFAGRYNTDNEYCGFVYDTSAKHFKVFDSMTGFDNDTKAIDNDNASFANIVGKGFESNKGQIGSELTVIINPTNSLAMSLSSLLALHYGPENYGIYCGRLIGSSYSTGYSSFAITTLNYTLSRSLQEGTVFTATVDIETKHLTHNYLSYDDDTETLNYIPPSDADENPPTLLIRILPINTINF